MCLITSCTKIIRHLEIFSISPAKFTSLWLVQSRRQMERGLSKFGYFLALTLCINSIFICHFNSVRTHPLLSLDIIKYPQKQQKYMGWALSDASRLACFASLKNGQGERINNIKQKKNIIYYA